MQPSKSQGVIGDEEQHRSIPNKYRSSVESVRRSRDSANTAAGTNYNILKQNDEMSLVLSR